VTSNPPRESIVTPTGRPKVSPDSVMNPVSTSTGSPAGCAPSNGTKMTLYPLRGARFHEPCCPMNMPFEKRSGSVVPPDQANPSDAVWAPSA
jgi:hypothetical protein